MKTHVYQAVKAYCLDILSGEACRKLPYHNRDHTEAVVENVQTIGQNSDFTAEEIETIQIAAWFHDTGFSQVYHGHEEVSIELAQRFLVKQGYPAPSIDVVISCIEATKIPQNPSNRYAEVLSDADIFHISNCSFFYRKVLLRREWELVLHKSASELEWHQINLAFLQGHHFFTRYGKEVLMKGQKENEKKVLHLIQWYQ